MGPIMLRQVVAALACASAAGGPGGPIDVVVAGSPAHYPGMVGVVASAAAAAGGDAGRLRFLLLVGNATDAPALAAAARCAGGGAAVTARAFALDAALGGAGPLSPNARLAEPLNYARFFVGELVPRDAARAIYLDADVSVAASLAVLDAAAAAAFAENASAVVAAVPRDFKRVCDSVVRCGHPAVRAAYRDPARALHAFNAGVVVFDIGRWRATGRLAAAERWIAANGRSPPPAIYKLGSNPPLVLAVGPDWVRLDARWNCMRGIHRQHPHNVDCWEDAFIRHYPGGAKPWAATPAAAADLRWTPPAPRACAPLAAAARAAPFAGLN